MILEHGLFLLLLCGFTALSASTETCGEDLLEGTSCIIKLPEKYNDKSNDIKWIHLSSDAVIERKNNRKKSNTPGLTIEDDGSLRFNSVSLNNTGSYRFTVTRSDGTEIAKGDVEIKVYDSGVHKLFGFNFWTVVSILSAGGAFLLLLICVFIICVCRRRQRHKKHQPGEEELRLAALDPDHTGTNNSEQTTREELASPILPKDPMPDSPSTLTRAQPKAQIRVQPPTPAQDEDQKNLPPIPHPRTKKPQTKRNQEPN